MWNKRWDMTGDYQWLEDTLSSDAPTISARAFHANVDLYTIVSSIWLEMECISLVWDSDVTIQVPEEVCTYFFFLFQGLLTSLMEYPYYQTRTFCTLSEVQTKTNRFVCSS